MRPAARFRAHIARSSSFIDSVNCIPYLPFTVRALFNTKEMGAASVDGTAGGLCFALRRTLTALAKGLRNTR
jgi:hypothetical protein